MSGFHNKVLGAVLSAVLVFWCAFPVPVGVRPVDELTHDEAEAVAPAIPVLVVFGTALAAAGVYVAGTTNIAYNNNLQTLYDDFTRYAANEGSANAANFDSEHMNTTLSGAVTSDNRVDLGVLTQAGFFGLLPAFVSQMVEGGSMVQGSSSYVGNHVRGASIEQYSVRVFDGEPPFVSGVPSEMKSFLQQDGRKLVAYYAYYLKSNNNLYSYRGYYAGGASFYQENNLDYVKYSNVATFNYYVSNNRYLTDNTVYESAKMRLYDGLIEEDTWLNKAIYYKSDLYIVDEVNGTEVIESNYYSGAVEPDLLEGTSSYPTETVEAFNPTDALLESGFSKLDAIDASAAASARASEAMSVDVSSILSGVGSIATLLTPVGAISTAVSSISANWNSIAAGPWAWLQNWWNTFTGYWATLFQKIGDTPLSTLLAPLSGVATIVTALNGQGGLLQWLGSTTIGDLFASVLSGMADLSADIVGALDGLEVGAPDLSGVSDAIGTAAGTLEAAVNDVNTWLGTLSGWWEGLNTWAGVDGLTLEDILAGVLSGALAGDLAGVIEAIQAAVASMVATLDGVVEGVRAPKLPDFSLATPVVTDDSEVRRMVSQKAPFAYILAINQSLGSINGTYSSTPSFYWDVNIPFAGNIRVDAGTWLNYDVHGRTIAQLLKLSFNAFVIVMLLGFVYKAMQRAI